MSRDVSETRPSRKVQDAIAECEAAMKALIDARTAEQNAEYERREAEKARRRAEREHGASLRSLRGALGLSAATVAGMSLPGSRDSATMDLVKLEDGDEYREHNAKSVYAYLLGKTSEAAAHV